MKSRDAMIAATACIVVGFSLKDPSPASSPHAPRNDAPALYARARPLAAGPTATTATIAVNSSSAVELECSSAPQLFAICNVQTTSLNVYIVEEGATATTSGQGPYTSTSGPFPVGQDWAIADGSGSVRCRCYDAPLAAGVNVGGGSSSSVFTTTVDGLVPHPGSTTGKFLEDNGSWAAPATGVGGSGVQAKDFACFASTSTVQSCGADLGANNTASYVQTGAETAYLFVSDASRAIEFRAQSTSGNRAAFFRALAGSSLYVGQAGGDNLDANGVAMPAGDGFLENDAGSSRAIHVRSGGTFDISTNASVRLSFDGSNNATNTANWTSTGYLATKAGSGAPTAGDCSSGTAGRLYVDTADNLYACDGTAWKKAAIAGFDVEAELEHELRASELAAAVLLVLALMLSMLALRRRA